MRNKLDTQCFIFFFLNILFLGAFLLFPAQVIADTCGNIENADGTSNTISDCDNPFNATTQDTFTVSIDSAVFGNNETASVHGSSTAFFSITADSHYSHRLFRQTASGYEEVPLVPRTITEISEGEVMAVLRQHFAPDADLDLLAAVIRQEQSFSVLSAEDAATLSTLTFQLQNQFNTGLYENLPEGTYTLVSTEDLLCVSEATTRPWWMRLFGSIAHAACADPPEVRTTTFSVTQLPPLPEPIDPLLLQYAPILQFHEDEQYFPMNVEAFVAASALWSESGVQISDVNTLTMSQFEEAIGTTATDSTYLAFSDPTAPQSIDLSMAKATYDDLVASGAATSTMYVHKMEDSYVDSFGVEHEFIVLQYWFFYAMNNWEEQGGFNNHEGDWESVFVFLDADTNEPEYVAFSSHLNDGFPNLNEAQYASVRKRWNNEVETIGDSVKSYAALGSHANYADFNEGKHLVIPDPRSLIYDEVSRVGSLIKQFNFIGIDEMKWSEYDGLWGVSINEEGKDGPQGPKYIDVTGQTRYYEPIEWAGLDNVDVLLVDTATNFFDFTKQGVSMLFDEVVESGTQLSVDLHEEAVNFGENVADIQFLPNFFDLESTLDNGSFNVSVTLPYNPDVVEALQGEEEHVEVMYFNESTGLWEAVETNVDIADDTATFETAHFSRYALAIKEPPSLEELYGDLRTVIEESNLPSFRKRIFLQFVDHSERMTNSQHTVFMDVERQPSVNMLKTMLRQAARAERKGRMETGDLVALQDTVAAIKSLLKAGKDEQVDGIDCSQWSASILYIQKCGAIGALGF